ncbi:hypothetical protein B0H17DRAFT_1210087 [Mycena rosella]|uniref:Uncharacterized protein n=1 Tax=Mycena rosella TaxID=1033263 RepID=A0AAD7G4Z6_MYCRO|nr:hypothetical protein B0H17DRAFT_1210087 [Mycena rosella]
MYAISISCLVTVCASLRHEARTPTMGNKPSHVRLYRDCSAADLAFTAFITVLAAYAAWAPGRLACEDRQPELAWLLAMLSPDETCER